MYQRRFLHPARLLQEAREGWEYFITDELVYVNDNIPPNTNSETLRQYNFGADIYPNFWLEMLLSTFREGNYGVLIEIVRSNPESTIGQTCIGIEHSPGNEIQSPVFMPPNHCIQELQENRFRPCRTIVWLTRLDEIPSGFWQEFSGTEEHRLIWVRHNREHNVPFFRWRNVHTDRYRQSPNKIVQSGPERINNLSEPKRPGLRQRRCPYQEEFLFEGIKVFIDTHQLQMSLQEPLDTPIKSIDVFIRPVQLEPGIMECFQELYSNHEQERQESLGKAKNPKGPRDSHSNTGRIRGELRQGGEAGEKITASPPEEGLTRTSLGHRLGGYTAKHTRSGSPEDA